MPAPVVRVENLRVEIDGQTLVDGVSLTARPGRCTALVGPSGSGKSTTGLALLGEYPAGARVTGVVDVTGRAGYIPQNPAAALNPVRRSGALLADIARRGPGSRAARTARVHDALRAAQLPDPELVSRRYPHQLSGGQQQRVVLAQALLSGASVVVADEPTTGQDPLTKRRVVDELRALLARNVAVVLLSHDRDVVAALADEVVALEAAPAPAPRSPHPALPADAGPSPSGPGPSPSGPGPSPSGPGPDPADAEPDPVLRVASLTAWHGRRSSAATVLRDASLGVPARGCLAVIGRSGSGKTTLARCLAGLHRRWSGTALLDGVPLPAGLRDRTREQLAAVQYVFQDARASFDEHRTVLDQVARTAVRLRQAAPEAARGRARAVLGEVGLPEATVARRPSGLSGGELQRAALVRALLARPRVLLCDEITSGLDPGARAAVTSVLTGLRARTSVVLITHDLGLAAELADLVAVVHDGRVVESGPAATVLDAPVHPASRRLLAAGVRLGRLEGSRRP